MADSSAAQHLYWSDGNLFAIKRASLTDTGAVTAVAEGQNYSYLAYDPMGRMIYYSIADPLPMLWCSRPDGAQPQKLLTFDSHHFVRGMAIDAVAGKIYWSSSDGYVAGNGKIRRANLDGSELEDLVTGMVYPYGMALDMANGRMFWIRQEDTAIWRANLDGSDSRRLLPLGSSSYAFCLALDTANSRLYWTDSGNSSIQSANLEGTDVRRVAALDQFSLDAGITLDPGPNGQWQSIGAAAALGTGKPGGPPAALYWADTINHKVYTAALDGTAVRVFLEGEPNYAQSLLVIRDWEIALNASGNGRDIVLTWNSRAGLSYRVQAKSAADIIWADISGRVPATDRTTSWTDTNANSAEARLYRVKMD